MTDKEMFAFANEVGIHRGMQQSEEEIIWALEEMRRYFGSYQPKIFLEIGCANGRSLCMWSQLLDANGLLIGISPGSEDVVQDRARVVREKTNKSLIWINGRSEDHDTMDRLVGILDGRKLDAVFIDSLHTYEQSKLEHSLYLPLVSIPGVLGYHDIVQGGLSEFYDDVPCTGDFWHEIKYEYNYIEKHNKNSGVNFGIGLIFK